MIGYKQITIIFNLMFFTYFQLNMEKYTLFFLGGFVAEVIGTVSGFGSSILFVPLASLFFDFQVVLGITAVFHVFSNLSKIALFREGIDKHIALWLGIPAILFVISLLGSWTGKKILDYIPQQWFKYIVLGVILATSLFQMIQYFRK